MAARALESGVICNALVSIGNNSYSEAIRSCATQKNGLCLIDLKVEEGKASVSVLAGRCAADSLVKTPAQIPAEAPASK